MKNSHMQALKGLLIGGGAMAGLALMFSVWTAVEYQSGGGEDPFAPVFGQALKLFLWLIPFAGLGGWLVGYVRAYIHTHDGPVCTVLHCALVGGLALFGLGFLAAIGLGIEYGQDWGKAPTPMAVIALWGMFGLPALFIGLIGGGIYGGVIARKA